MTARQHIAELSTRELQLLALMAAGHSNSAISDELWLSPKTVETHVRSIFTKLGLRESGTVHRRVLAVLMYLDAVAPVPGDLPGEAAGRAYAGDLVHAA